MVGKERGFFVTQEKLEDIKVPAEREFARFLLNHNPNLRITYEPQYFGHTNGDGKPEGTLPDFLIYDHRTKREIYVEITFSPRNGTDPKARQKRVMEANGKRYVVLYLDNLVKIKAAHPEYSLGR